MSINIIYKKIFLLILLSFSISYSNEQAIGTFNSIPPTDQTQNLVLPNTHTFQQIIQSGKLLSSGQTLGNNLDFTGYVPISGSSKNGFLSISSETSPAECAILSLTFNNSLGLWETTNGGKVSFVQGEIGNVWNFCSGTITPNNTIMVCEESTVAMDANNDGYQDLGWVIEIDPATRTVINQDGTGGSDKLWALGRAPHENVAISKTNSTLYWGTDNSSTGYLYKFVPTSPGNFSSGLLYVLQTTSNLGTGIWKLINNTSQADRNNTLGLSTAAGAYNFNRIEDVEIGPDGKIYFTATADGIIYRLRDLGNGNVDQLEIFVASTNYDVDGEGLFLPEPWGIGNDNLAFDGEGNLWVLQDGSRNHIWVVGPTHSVAAPDVRLFATTPLGSEPTGITFTPDYKYMFLSIQHPLATNNSPQIDAGGRSTVFNTHTTVVISRKEFLGSLASIPLPVKLTQFNAAFNDDKIEIQWTAEQAYNHSYFDVERSLDGIRFQAIYRNSENLQASKKLFTYFDYDVANGDIVYYRIKQCDLNGNCNYSEIKTIRLPKNKNINVYPVPVSKSLNVEYNSLTTKKIIFSIINNTGIIQMQQPCLVKKGSNKVILNTENLITGTYYLFIQDDKGQRKVQNFIKVK